MGGSFVIEAFVTVVAGGADVAARHPAGGPGCSAVIKATATALYGQVYGVMGLLVAVCLVIRVLPEGFTGWLIRARAHEETAR